MGPLILARRFLSCVIFYPGLSTPSALQPRKTLQTPKYVVLQLSTSVLHIFPRIVFSLISLSGKLLTLHFFEAFLDAFRQNSPYFLCSPIILIHESIINILNSTVIICSIVYLIHLINQSLQACETYCQRLLQKGCT